ncbi:hypothetical protein VP01_953g2 [Puccinia sorghi]|uniref:Uncharacterized protein n=1 Tax=Puccinia sorghi TaxID=27349 RepID=A0A0L6U699_9BASI|nr:hypothetical protein VP01_953g2 [Puccinia sorghi]
MWIFIYQVSILKHCKFFQRNLISYYFYYNVVLEGVGFNLRFQWVSLGDFFPFILFISCYFFPCLPLFTLILYDATPFWIIVCHSFLFVVAACYSRVEWYFLKFIGFQCVSAYLIPRKERAPLGSSGQVEMVWVWISRGYLISQLTPRLSRRKSCGRTQSSTSPMGKLGLFFCKISLTKNKKSPSSPIGGMKLCLIYLLEVQLLLMRKIWVIIENVAFIKHFIFYQKLVSCYCLQQQRKKQEQCLSMINMIYCTPPICYSITAMQIRLLLSKDQQQHRSSTHLSTAAAQQLVCSPENWYHINMAMSSELVVGIVASLGCWPNCCQPLHSTSLLNPFSHCCTDHMKADIQATCPTQAQSSPHQRMIPLKLIVSSFSGRRNIQNLHSTRRRRNTFFNFFCKRPSNGALTVHRHTPSLHLYVRDGVISSTRNRTSSYDEATNRTLKNCPVTHLGPRSRAALALMRVTHSETYLPALTPPADCDPLHPASAVTWEPSQSVSSHVPVILLSQSYSSRYIVPRLYCLARTHRPSQFD